MTAKQIQKMVKSALREFGRYSFVDKGAREVMDLEPILDHLKALPAEQARDLLEAVASCDEYCHQLVTELVIDLQDQPEEWWDMLMSSETLEEMYA